METDNKGTVTKEWMLNIGDVEFDGWRMIDFCSYDFKFQELCVTLRSNCGRISVLNVEDMQSHKYQK